MLEIIGNVWDPEPIKKHVKKVFAGIYTIEVPPTNTRAKTFQVNAIRSEEGESVPLINPVQGQP